jgi:hypothetical protein
MKLVYIALALTAICGAVTAGGKTSRAGGGACNPLAADCRSGFPCAVEAFAEEPYRFVTSPNRYGEKVPTAEQWAEAKTKFDYVIAVTRAYVRHPTPSRRAYLARNAPMWFRGVADSVRQRVRRERLRGNRLRITQVNIDWKPLLHYPDAPLGCYASEQGWSGFLVELTYEIRTNRWPKIGPNVSGPNYVLMMGPRVYQLHP